MRCLSGPVIGRLGDGGPHGPGPPRSPPRDGPSPHPSDQGVAILAHQNGSSLRHADETSRRVRALPDSDGSGYAWLWTSVGRGAVYFHVDRSRSAEAARKLFGGAVCPTVLVCDRYSGYKRLARVLGDRVTLSFGASCASCASMFKRAFCDIRSGCRREQVPVPSPSFFVCLRGPSWITLFFCCFRQGGLRP